MFAKLYEDAKLGQVLLTKETVDHPEVVDETCPAIKIQISAEGMRFGIELPFPNTDDGFDKRNLMFAEFTEDRAIEAAEGIVQEIIELADKERDNEESD